MKSMSRWLSRLCVGAIAATYVMRHDMLSDTLWLTQTIESWTLPEFSFDGSLVGTSNPSSDDFDDSSDGRHVWVQQPPGKVYREFQEGTQRAHQKNHFTTLRAFREAIGDTWKSTVQVLDGNKQIALGAVVRADGWIVTKASELPEHSIEVRLHDGTRAQGQIQSRRPECDLALIKINRTNLSPIVWNESAEVPLGGWLASADARNLPVAIGVVSVKSRNVHPERAVLGVSLGDAKNGALVQSVVKGSGAFRGGVIEGDTITEIDGKKLANRREVLDCLFTIAAGQRIKLVVARDGRSLPLDAQMMDLHSSLLDETEMEVNGNISARSTGFRNVVQHDTVLAPHQCGGPLVDVNGNVVGINIARAGRISSYALPSKTVSPAVTEMLASATGEYLTPEGKVVPASALEKGDGTVSLPASIPSGIRVETLKPEVVFPGLPQRVK